jgi:hypothetical protein
MQYRAQLPSVMIPHLYCAVHGGSLAGMSTNAPSHVATAAPAIAMTVEEVPVARAVPASSTTSGQAPPGASYQMIQKDHGFIFLHDR